MLDPNAERLYNLLPAIYRQRDQRQGQPLRALMAVMQDTFLTLQADIEALYDNWFIETADDWVVPYLADLVGINDLSSGSAMPFSQRRRVANTIAYRRRKGTPAALEHILQDVSDWGVHVVEYAPKVAAAQHLAHPRLSNHLVDIRRTPGLLRVNGPFDPLTHSLDVHDGGVGAAAGAPSTQGRYHPAHIGIFVWRLKTYPVYNSPARALEKDSAGNPLPPGCYTFDPLGRDQQLFHLPAEVRQITSRTVPSNLPIAIDRSLLSEDLVHAVANPTYQTYNSTFYGLDRSLFVISNGKGILPGEIGCVDLGRWQVPSNAGHKKVWIDPQLGRLIVTDHALVKRGRVEVNYARAFSADMGGGPYSRSQSFPQLAPDTFVVDVAQGSQVASLGAALELWKAQIPFPSRCVIQFWDNRVYDETNLVVQLPRNGQLVIRAGDGYCPVLRCRRGMRVENPQAGASLVLNGLHLDGQLQLEDSIHLSVQHCTLLPFGITAGRNAGYLGGLNLTISNSFCGAIRLPAEIEALSVNDSILDGQGHAAVAGVQNRQPGPQLTMNNVTVFGLVHVQAIVSAACVLFNERLEVEDTRVGSISYSYIPLGSKTPPLSHCQPEAGTAVYPLFTSTRFGDPGYAQLKAECASEILRGAEDGAEIGAFHKLYQIQRQDSLRNILDEYLPFGLSAGITYIT